MNLPKHIAQASIFITHRYLQLAQVVTSHLGVHPSSYIQLARDTIQTDRYESNLDYIPHSKLVLQNSDMLY